MRTRCTQVLVRMTPDEHVAIAAAARDYGMTVTDFVIARALASAHDGMETARLEAALTEALEAIRDALVGSMKEDREEMRTVLDEHAKRVLAAVNEGMRRVRATVERLGSVAVAPAPEVPGVPPPATSEQKTTEA